MMLIFYVKTIQTDVYKLLPIPLLRLQLQYDTNEKLVLCLKSTCI